MKAYRLCGAQRDPRDPTGAKKWGGRWNSPGNAALYAASSLALACLEIVVHLREIQNLPSLVYVTIDIPDTVIARWEHSDARTEEIMKSQELSRAIGDRWRVPFYESPLPTPFTTAPDFLTYVKRQELFPEIRHHAAKEVPSVVIPQEWNYVLNPASSSFDSLSWSEPKAFQIDPRLVDPELR